MTRLRDQVKGMELTVGDEMERRGTKMKELGEGNGWRGFVSSYFSAETFLILVWLLATLIFLPLLLPPLPSPPILLLLVPVGILVMLLILAFLPSDVKSITSSYL
ncbi:protein AUXIN-REGULATED INVOLVED IN ORGAN SIZE-like [Canna indica]|uniref:Protein AUXIN-REGULATED INVOLVED IN ORGAN SIZE-like n=1 Tax=Canna indica TaxID=4628 RepID=A0AAQ3K9G0_9LILI|nr:protein AUXIN-REGULATED INVOLVED IN ORGAN SIZE-like [Canna indica]